MSRAYTSYTTIRCGNRKMAERIELIFQWREPCVR